MRRLNVKLTLWLVGITLFSMVGVHFLHGYQIDKNADYLKREAEQAVKDGKPKEAVKHYNQFLKHRDDPEGYSALAKLVVDMAEDEGASRQERFRAYSILEEAIRRHPDLHDVRKRLLDYTMAMRRFTETQDHIRYLNENAEGSPELEYKSALCMYFSGDQDKAMAKLAEIVGYRLETKQFTESPPPGASEIPAFNLLAQLLRQKGDDGAKAADGVMLQSVTWNPDSATAHMTRGVFLVEKSRGDIRDASFIEAKGELDRALELDPSDADVVLRAATYAMAEADYERSQELLDKALKEHPERAEVYMARSQLKQTEGDLKGAAEQLSMGLGKATKANNLFERLVDLQFQLNDVGGARETWDKMAKANAFPPELLQYIEARLKLADGNTVDATADLEKVRPALARYANSTYPLQIDLLLSRCYESMGQPDKQLMVCTRVLNERPDLVNAHVGVATALQALGRHEDPRAVAAIKAIQEASRNNPGLVGLAYQLSLNDQLRKSEDARNWSEVERLMAQLLQDESRPEVDKTLLKADLLIHQKNIAEANKLLNAARKEHPKDIRVWISLSKSFTRNGEPDKAQKLLTLAEKEVGDVILLRAERLRVLLNMGGKTLVAELDKLEQGLDKFTTAEQTALLAQLGASHLSQRDYDGAKRCWQAAIAQDPKNRQLRQYMFEVMLDQKDSAGMAATIKEIQDSKTFGVSSPLYKYCAAAQMLSQVGDNVKKKPGALSEADRKTVADARKLVDEALRVRNDWSPLWRLQGEADQLEGRLDSAIQNYQKSLNNSFAGQGATARRLVHLLHTTKRYAEANEALKYLDPNDNSEFMHYLILDIKTKNGKVDDSLADAEKFVENNPDNALGQLTYGQLLEIQGRPEDAESAYRKATEVKPDLPDGWDNLVRRLMLNKKKEDALAAVEEASKSLEKKPVALGRLYERIDDRAKAEARYQEAVEQDASDALAARRLIEFHLNTQQSDKALPELDKFMSNVAKSKDADQADKLGWARRVKAEIVGSSRDYQSVVKAVSLIEQNAKDGKLNDLDTLTIATMLANRPEPESRAKAMRLLENMQRKLQPRERVALGQLYSRAKRWPEARTLLTEAVAARGDDPEPLLIFAQLLVQHDEHEEAEPYLEQLEKLFESSTASVPDRLRQPARALRAQIYAKRGNKEKAVATLDAILPRPLPPARLPMLAEVSALMESFELYDGAEALLDEYMAQDSRGSIAMAAFLGRRGKVDEQFAMLQEARKSQSMIDILSCGLDGLRRHPEQRSPEKFSTLKEWATTGAELEAKSEKETKSQQIRLLTAEIYDMEGNYDEAMKIYQDMLKSDAPNQVQKAIVKNNMAFILSAVKVNEKNLAEALKLINECIQVLGPTSDVLDTRALVYLSQGNLKSALVDLQAAIADAPSIHKYFHLARAEKQAGNLEGARTAMAEAKKLGAEPKKFGVVEEKQYTQLVDALK